MGKFRTKLKGQSKGKRWKKGQSASSNPEIHKYRDKVRSNWFQPTSASSNLTLASLRIHDAAQSFSIQPPSAKQANHDLESRASTATTYMSMKSFASEWSDCSNMSFNRFLTVFRSDSALHKEMLAILAALADVIKANEGSESSTEYYAALLTTLDQVYDTEVQNEEQITAVLSLLNMGIRTVPEPVLRKHFDKVASKMLQILNDYVNKDNNTVIKSVLGILASLLRKQELTVWTQANTVQVFEALLNPFCIHSKPKWRKAGQDAVTLVVKSDYFISSSSNLAADKVAEFCEQILDTCLGGTANSVAVSSIQTGQTTILHVLGLMKDNISNFSKSYIKRCCEIVLRLVTLNYPIVTSCSFQVLHALFSSQKAVVPATLNAQLISALYEYQPGVLNLQATLAWLAVMEQAHIHLADVDVALSCAVLPKFFTAATQLWLSEKPEVTTAVTHTLKSVLKDALTPVCENKELIEHHSAKLNKCFGLIELALGYQYHNVWHQVMHVIEVMFQVGGENCSHMLLNCLKTLAELRDSYKFTYNTELEHAVGAAVRYMGPETVLNIISLKKENGDLNLDRSWMLPVLKENIKGSTLDYYMKGILPLALYCQRRSAQLAEANDGIGSHSSELLYMQLWNLLPCFCNNPTDIKENFKGIAKVLGVAISDRKELRLSVMASLRKLIISAKQSDNAEDLAELTKFAKNYLPILFNVYTTKPIGTDEEGQRLAALDTIKVYLSIAKPQLTQELLNNAIERLNTSSDDPEDPFIKESILDLIRALVPYQNLEHITILYEQCVKQLLAIKNNKEQKKAYRLLEEICSSESETCKQFIKNNRKEVQRLLKKSLESAAIASKGARLRCLNYLLKAQPQLDHDSKLIKSVIPEAILACKNVNERTRSIAYEVLNTIGEILQQHDQLQQFVTMVIAGFAGTPQLISCTVLALTSILYHFSGSLGQENIRFIVENVKVLMTAPTREIVGPCLSFIKVYCKVLPSPLVNISLPLLVKCLTDMTEDCKRHFRLKVRDILTKLVRKYGYESITPHVPLTDTVMYKRLRNIRKINDRKKRQKEAHKEESESEDEEFAIKSKPKSVEDILADSDSDLDEDESQTKPKGKARKQVKTWIEEDPDTIVDFTNPSVVSKITATKPGQSLKKATDSKGKDKDRGFKTASDGRLIIADVSDGSDGDDKAKLSSEDSDTEKTPSIAETLVLSNRKRKRSTSSVKSGFSRSSQPMTKYKTGGSGIHRSTAKSSVLASTGENKTKSAKGNGNKKGQLKRLNKAGINKRKNSKAAGSLKHIVKAAKEGKLTGHAAFRK